MPLEFRKISEFRRGTLAALLTDAYSFDCRCAQYWSADWREFDDFFFEHLQIADRYGFITVLDGEAIGLASWDPRYSFRKRSTEFPGMITWVRSL